MDSPAGSHEFDMLELSGAWEPLYSYTLQKKVLEEDPILVFIIETKFEVSEMARIKKKLER